MPAQTLTHEDRILTFLEQQGTKPVSLKEISQATQLPEETLKGALGHMSKNGGQVQRIGQSSYMYSKAPLPRQGDTFTGEVVATSYTGATIVRDSTGGSWKIEPV